MKTLTFCAATVLTSAAAFAQTPVEVEVRRVARGDVRTPINQGTTPGDADSVYRITEPGSYYLTRNLAGQMQKHGIEVDAAGVTIDLMGFHLRGGSVSFAGIRATADADGLRVHSGSLAQWGAGGIDTSAATRCVVEDVVVSECSGYGISLGAQSRVRDVIAEFNSADGIVALEGVSLRDVIARGNGRGIVVGKYSSLTDSAAIANLGAGIEATVGDVIIRHCIATDNGTHGILAGGLSSVSGCLASDNDGDGLRLPQGGRVASSTFGNNGDRGLDAEGPSLIRDCQAGLNSDDGIAMTDEGAVRGCHSFANIEAGISCRDDSFVFENVITSHSATSGHAVRMDGYRGTVVRNMKSDGDIWNPNGPGIGMLGLDVSVFGYLWGDDDSPQANLTPY